jgi:uncharacterized membrane-anchored protein YjiN (DUF445 family)
MEQGQHWILFDAAAERAREFLGNHHDYIHRWVADHTLSWLPRWVDTRLADKVVAGLTETLDQTGDPTHPWKVAYNTCLTDFLSRLTNDPRLAEQGERIKIRLLGSTAMATHLDGLATRLEIGLRTEFAAESGLLAEIVEQGLRTFARWLEDNPPMRLEVNGWIQQAILRGVVPYRDEIGGFVTDVVTRWDNRTLVGKLENLVGRDLQYIRINGTIVGGLMGLAIFLTTKLLEQGWERFPDIVTTTMAH